MKKIVAILMVMIMVISVTVVLAGSAADNDTKTKEPVIIGFKSTPSQADKAMVRGHGGDITYSYTIINAIAAKLPEPAIENIQKNPRVTYVEMDGEVHTLEDTLPWGVDRIDAELVWNGAEDGCDVIVGRNAGTGVNVAILDTGIDYNHPDLNDNYMGGYDFANGDSDPMDDNGHGTHCAGILAAEDNGEGVVGVAPEAYLYAVKVLNSGGSGSVSDVIAGIEWSVTNMQVISMSLGGGYSESMEAACDAAYNAGIVVVASAGNSGNPPGKGDNVGYPAGYSSVIAVAATDSNDNRASFSSTGPDVELASIQHILEEDMQPKAAHQWHARM
jgi:subtilisin/minor extracellular protease Epr